jgi:uncharacterized protein YggT (Ycf19 family)
MNPFNNMEPNHKGILIMIGGMLLLAETLGFLGKSLNIAMMILAAYMIVYGFVKAGLHHTIQKFVEAHTRKK